MRWSPPTRSISWSRTRRAPLFCPPNLPIPLVEHAIALNVSTLVRDGGTLQLGIGELGDAIVYALQLRHQQPAVYREVLEVDRRARRGIGA